MQHYMNNAWNIRSEIYDLLHRWPLVFLVFLLGSLLGWGAGWLVPSPYRAEFELYVAYNGDRIYRNSDDYKNWQLSELEIYIYSDDMLASALDRLRQTDAYWNDFSVTEIRPALHTYWRNAGKWRLVAEWDQPERAAQIASAWGAAVVENTRQAVEQGRLAMELGDRIRALSREEAQLAQRIARLAGISRALIDWKSAASLTASDRPLDVLERWRLQSLAAGFSDLNPAAQILLTQYPPADAPVQEVIPWADLLSQTVADEQTNLQGQEAELAQRREELTRQWEAASGTSRNLTADLYVEQIADITPKGEPVRITASLALIGGLLGLLGGAFWWLTGARRKTQP